MMVEALVLAIMAWTQEESAEVVFSKFYVQYADERGGKRDCR